ncbi:acyl carrier protein [Bosea sp. RAF48]|uniref:acyl carrier protein n=1 Tax=Bosea sp. RAF48 TaxID=3237480 RepID=UPI003F92F477
MSNHTASEAALAQRLLEIIAREGLIHHGKLDPTATVEGDLGLSLDDLTLIGNAIEREFDCDMIPDDEMRACTTVRQLVVLIAHRIATNAEAGESEE